MNNIRRILTMSLLCCFGLMNAQVYRDVDNDGYGTGTAYFFPPGDGYNYVSQNGDCNDNNSAINPGRPESFDGIDNNCAGGIDEGFAIPMPSAPTITQYCGLTRLTRGNSPYSFVTWHWQSSPSGTNTSTGPANNSTSPFKEFSSGSVYYLRARHNFTGRWSSARTINYSITQPTVWYADSDGDTYGNASSTLSSCSQPSGYVSNDDDYDDTTANITNVPPQTFYRDVDGDGFGNPSVSVFRSFQPSGYVTNDDDLDDTTANITNVPPQTFYRDVDGDGFGNPAVSVFYSFQPSGYVTNDDDLDDTTANITNIPPQLYYGDADGDGFGDPAVSGLYSVQPVGYVDNDDDVCPNEAGTFSGCITPTCAYMPKALSQAENYVLTINPLSAMTSTAGITHCGDAIETVSYFDGLGRLKQNVAIGASPLGKDMVTHVGYDAIGRQGKDYLPVPVSGSGGGGYESQAGSLTHTYYHSEYADDFVGQTASNINPYSEKSFEASPLNRVLKQAAPGKDWRKDGGHEIEFKYNTNTGSEVRRFSVTFSGGDSEAPQLAQNGNYDAGELNKMVTYDENHNGTSSKLHSTEEFTDKMGRVVLKRTYALVGGAETDHDTYYVYDDFGNLTYVIPPKVTTASVSASELSELCYQYKYDHRNRLIEKKIPGKDPEEIVYNKLDQPILTRDANLQANNQWLFTKYDAFGRVAYTGMVSSSSSRTAHQTAADGISVQYESSVGNPENHESSPSVKVYYSNSAYPNTNISKIYTANYYDDYRFDDSNDNTFDLVAPTGSVLGQSISSNTKGLPTGSRIRVLGTDDWITTITGYDAKGRAIYTASKNNYLNTTDIVETKLDFAGGVEQVVTSHTKGSNPAIVTTDNFTYDHMGRLLTQTQTIGSHTETIVENNYDELGQLVQKKVGGGLQTVDYEYNVRGWLKQINDPSNLGNDLFAFGINYNDPAHGAAPQYIQNVAETEWKTANDNILRLYSYGYDAFYRLENATSHNGNYDLTMAYDKMGNVTSLTRQGHVNSGATSFGVMDNLVYTYDNGNKLLRVTDNGNDTYGFRDGTNTNDDFGYDGNANMVLDRNKGITSISYNHLDMPTSIAVNGNGHNGTISFVYDANGEKLRRVTTEGASTTTTDYAGSFVYENGNLKLFDHPEGYVEPDGSGWQYVYRYADIWGNTRITYADDNGDGSVNSSEIRREQNYYPWGLEHKGYNGSIYGAKNDLKTYQGQEFTDDLGLNFHEWRYRASYPDIVRFWQVDPLAEDYMYNSTFAFQENKFGIGTELEGLEVNPFDAHSRLKGLGRAIKDAAVGMVELAKYVGPTGAAQASVDFAPAAAAIAEDPKGVANAIVDNVTESLKTPEGQGYALGTIFTLFDPSPAGEAGAVLKTADKVVDVATDVSKAANKADFIVTPDGTSVPTSQRVMREGFENAGFDSRPATQTSEAGQINTVPTQNGAVDVRTMEGSANHPRRAVFTEAGTNNPVRVGGQKFRNNEPRNVRREESHLRQNN